MPEDVRTRTYEELIMNRITRCFEAMDAGSEEMFDEVTQEIEMLFKLQPELYNALMTQKAEFQNASNQAYQISVQKVEMLSDDLNKDIRRKHDESVIEWSYRKDMLEAVLSILNQYQLIPFTNPVYAEIRTSMPEPAQQPVQPVQPVQQPGVEQPVPPQPSQPVPPVPPVALSDTDIEDEIERLKREEAEIDKLSSKPRQSLGKRNY